MYSEDNHFISNKQKSFQIITSLTEVTSAFFSGFFQDPQDSDRTQED